MGDPQSTWVSILIHDLGDFGDTPSLGNPHLMHHFLANLFSYSPRLQDCPAQIGNIIMRGSRGSKTEPSSHQTCCENARPNKAIKSHMCFLMNTHGMSLKPCWVLGENLGSSQAGIRNPKHGTFPAEKVIIYRNL